MEEIIAEFNKQQKARHLTGDGLEKELRGESNPYLKFRKLMSYSCKSTTCKAFLIFCRTIVELLQFLWKIPCHPKAAEDF